MFDPHYDAINFRDHTEGSCWLHVLVILLSRKVSLFLLYRGFSKSRCSFGCVCVSVCGVAGVEGDNRAAVVNRTLVFQPIE